MDDRTKRNEGRDKAERSSDVGTEPKKLSAQCNGLLARASEWVSKEKLFGNFDILLPISDLTKTGKSGGKHSQV